MWAFVLAFSISRPAQALDMQRVMHGDWMIVSAAMRHSPEQVDQILAQHAQTMKLGKGVRAVEERSIGGGCAHLTVRNRSLGRDLSYTAERCPIEGGWHSRLLESDDFEDHQIIWTTEPEGEGSRTTIRVKVKLRVPVPDFLVHRIVGSALEGTLEKIDSLLSAE